MATAIISASSWWMAGSLVLLLVLPGYLLASGLSRKQDSDLLVRLALWSGLSVALIPLALLWLTLARVPMTTLRVRGIFLGILALTVGRWLVWVNRSTGQRVAESAKGRFMSVSGASVVVTIVLLLAAALRFLPLRELALPSWIDSVHHVMVTQLILDQGGVPDSYHPFLPVSPFLYHFGFHALSAAFVWLTGASPALAVLLIGQTLNFLAPVGAYWLALRLTDRRWAGVVSAMVVGTLSLMPAHYVNWGRYTHLAGMTLLPAAMVLMGDVVEQGWRRGRVVLAAAVTLAGLALTHYRALVFALTYLGCYLLVSLSISVYLRTRSRWTLRQPLRSAQSFGSGQALVQRFLRTEAWSQGLGGRRTKVRREQEGDGPVFEGPWMTLSSCCLVASFLISPWLIRLGRAAFSSRGIWSGLVLDASYNAFPHDLLLASLPRPLAMLAVWGWLLSLWRRNKAVAAVGLWVAVLFLVANPHTVGLRTSPLVTNSSVIISLYLPVALLVSYFVAVVAAALERWMEAQWRRRYRYALGATAILAALWGAQWLWPVITPETVLVDEEDLLALSWIAENVPPRAKFLINAQLWQANIYVGTDAGYWIPVLTGRQTTVPPALYVQGPPAYVARINALAEMTTTGPDVDAAGFRAMLARERVTHVYLGAQGSRLRSQPFLDSSHYALIYASGNVWIFEVLRPDAG